MLRVVIARRLFALTFGALAAAMIALLALVAALLSPFRLGRLLRQVSIPRMAEHRLRTSLTVVGIALGVALLVSVMTVNQSIMRGVRATAEDLSGKADLQVGAGSNGFDEALVDEVRKVEGIAKVSPVLLQIATLQDARVRGERLLVLGVDLFNKDDAYFRDYQSAGLEKVLADPLSFMNSPSNILISRGLARRLGYKLHDRVPVATASGVQHFDIWGFLDEKGVGRAFGGAICVMYQGAMQVAFGRGTNIDRIDVAVAQNARADDVKRRLEALLGAGFTIERPSSAVERIARMLLGVQVALTNAGLIALFVAAFLIHNTMAISVVQRRRELGILRALGARRGELFRLLTLEGAVLGVAGALLGVALGLLLARGLMLVTSAALSEAFLQLAATDVDIDPTIVLGSMVVGLVFATVAAAIAAARVGRLQPADNLRTANVVQLPSSAQSLRRRDLTVASLLLLTVLVLQLPPIGPLQTLASVAAGALLLAGVLFIPRLVHCFGLRSRVTALPFMGLEAQLARANLPRDVGRTATTAGALMVGVAMAVAFATFIHSFTSTLYDWIDQTLQGDLFITNSATATGMSLKEVPMSDTLHAELLSLPGVESARRMSVIELPYQGYPVKLVSTEVELYARYSVVRTLEGSVTDALQAWKLGGIAVSENFARRFGVHRGDFVSLSTKNGTHKFKVGAVLVDYTSNVGAIYMDRTTYVDVYGDTRVGTYELHLKKGSDPLAVRRIVHQRFGPRYDLFVLTNRQLRMDIRGNIDQVFTLLRALELVALIVATLGIVNAQLANVVDRVREIGVLRAVGMLRKQVGKMVVFEAMLVGALGVVVGLLVGMALAYVVLNHNILAATGWRFPYRVSALALVELVVLTLVASAAAGFYPARSASRLQIPEALSYE